MFSFLATRSSSANKRTIQEQRPPCESSAVEKGQEGGVGGRFNLVTWWVLSSWGYVARVDDWFPFPEDIVQICPGTEKQQILKSVESEAELLVQKSR